MIMPSRGAFAATKQSPVARGDCSPALQQTLCCTSVAKCARNDMQLAALREGRFRECCENIIQNSAPLVSVVQNERRDLLGLIFNFATWNRAA